VTFSDGQPFSAQVAKDNFEALQKIPGRGLMSRPKLMLLDEPSMGLASMIVEEIFEIIQRLNRDERVSFLLAEQNAHLVLRYAHHGLVLENGRVAASGPAAELAARDDVSDFYLGGASAAPSLGPATALQ
jgi:branched-chain amino acid transport system ATP-binding protein